MPEGINSVTGLDVYLIYFPSRSKRFQFHKTFQPFDRRPPLLQNLLFEKHVNLAAQDRFRDMGHVCANKRNLQDR